MPPPKVQPKNFVLTVKTHKLTLFLTAPSSSSIASLKADVLSALTAPVLSQPVPFDALNTGAMDVDETEWEVPRITSEDEFELCRPIKEKGKLTGKYERLESRLQLKTTVVNWDTLFVQFQDMERGIFYPVKVSLPSLLEDDEDEVLQAPDPAEEAMSAVRKGKRKARPESPASEA